MSSTAAGGQSGTLRAGISDRAYVPVHPIVRIHLLGSMRATSYLGDDVLPRARKARAALGYLCLTPGARVSRTRIANLLWDRVNSNQARGSFSLALFELTSAMGPLAAELILSFFLLPDAESVTPATASPSRRAAASSRRGRIFFIGNPADEAIPSM